MDLDCIANVSATLKAFNLPTTHMVSTGGWDAPHSDTSNPPEAIYAAFVNWNKNIVARPGFENGFDGIDWDLEGADDINSPTNEFTVACLDLMGRFSQLAQADGYIVSIVPPESYLDPTTSLFDRSLTHAYPDGWQPNFRYHGHNAYAYLIAKFGQTVLLDTIAEQNAPTFDLILIQLYETYSHFDYNMTVLGQPPYDYLTSWVQTVTDGWMVDFSNDPQVKLPSQKVTVASSQLLIGFANAWATSPRTAFASPEHIGVAFQQLVEMGKQPPRGVFFWCISSEGQIPSNGSSKEPLFFASGSNAFLHTRNAVKNDV
jgi:hypothetical protein